MTDNKKINRKDIVLVSVSDALAVRFQLWINLSLLH